jgi:ornithine--oxo-acid transaminase
MSHKSLYDDRTYPPLNPESAELIRRTDKYSATNYHPYPFVVQETDGPWLIDPTGERALDFLSAYSAILTHRHAGVRDALFDAMNTIDLTSRALYSAPFVDMVETIAEFTGYDRVLPKSDGGSATDSAISGLLMHGAERGIAKPEVILTEEYFHGRTWVFASNAHFDPDQCERRNPKSPGIVVVPHTAEAVKAAINENTVGIFIETHKGEGGPLFTSKDTYMAIRKLATDNDIFIGCDEIQTGLGRCGYMMAWQEFGEAARPDFVTLGKALGGGYVPVSAVVGTEEFMSVYTPGTDGSTFGGFPMAAVAACSALRYIVDEDISGRSLELGDYFAAQLRQIPNVTVENRGLLIRVELHDADTAQFACKEMLLGKNRDLRVFMKHGHGDVERHVAYTRIAPPPGAMTKELIDMAVEKTIAPVLSGKA